jgi:hypothetical protein
MLTCGDLAQVCGFHVEWQADYAAMQCFFVFIQVGKSKSWNAKGDQFPKNIWVLICQIHLLRYPAFQPNPYPEHCKTT